MNGELSRRLIFFTLTFLTAGMVSGLSQDTSFNPLGRDIPGEWFEKQIRITVEWIELPQAEYRAVMREMDVANASGLRSSNDAPLREKLEDLIEQEKAILLETTMVIARSGQRAQVESISETIYPTEYDPPSAPSIRSDGDSNDNNIENNTISNTLPMATAFETRNVGTTLEVDPVLGPDDVTIDLNLAPEFIYYTGNLNWGTYVDGDSKMRALMPRFYTMKTTTQVTMRSGETVHISTKSPPDLETGKLDPSRKVLLFVRSDVLVVGLPLDRARVRKPGEKKKE